MQKIFTKSVQRRFSLANFNKHQKIISLYKFTPSVDEDAWVSASATLSGEVQIGTLCNIWPNTVIRGDLNAVLIGQSVSIFENCSIFTTHSILQAGEVALVNIGSNSIIMPGCTLISCFISAECFVGSNSVICEGARVEKGAIVGPNSVVPPNRVIPSGQVWAGNPVRFVKAVEKEDEVTMLFFLKEIANNKIAWRSEEIDINETYLEFEKLDKKLAEEKVEKTSMA